MTLTAVGADTAPPENEIVVGDGGAGGRRRVVGRGLERLVLARLAQRRLHRLDGLGDRGNAVVGRFERLDAVRHRVEQVANRRRGSAATRQVKKLVGLSRAELTFVAGGKTVLRLGHQVGGRLEAQRGSSEPLEKG